MKNYSIPVLLFIIFSFVSAYAGPDNDLIQDPTLRIIGGDDTEPGEWPWIAALIESYSDSLYSGHFCGGSLIHHKWVVTAAHCVEYDRPENIDIVVGIRDLENDTGDRIRVKRIIIHPDYDPLELDSDIALLELERNASEEPVPLVSAQGDLEGEEAVVLGWGLTQESSHRTPEILQAVMVPIVSNETCRASYPYDEVTDNMLCAGYSEGGKDACQGDSGGPLAVSDGETWRLAGIVSWGEGCAEPDYYGVYTRISRFRDFINEYVSLISLSIPETAEEGSGVLTGQGIITVRGAQTDDLTVILKSDNPSEIIVPDRVTIPAGQTSFSFDLSIPDDTLLDGSQSVVITAAAQNQWESAAVIQVNDNETADLNLTIPPSAVEGDARLAGKGRITVSMPVDKDVTVSLFSDDTSEVTVPESVTIEQGQTETNFDLTIIYDGKDDGLQTATITASVPGWTPGSAVIEVSHHHLDFFTEKFETDNDLDYQTLTFMPNGSGDFYRLCRENISAFPTDPEGTRINLRDDDYEHISLSDNAHVFLYGIGYSSFYVGSDGDISFGSGQNEKDRSLSFHFKDPRISGLLDDLNPEENGQIIYKQTQDRMVVTYLNIPEYDNRKSLNSFQIEMFFNQNIRITYLNIAAADGIAGISRGEEMPRGFDDSDLSASAYCQPPIPGDLDNSGAIDLRDAILALKHLTGADLGYISSERDVNGDMKIGMAEVIFILREVSAQR